MDMKQMLKQAQAMQEGMKKKGDEFDEKEFQFETGGGAIIINLLGDGEIVKIDINKDLLDPENKEMVEDMVLVGVNEAQSSVRTQKDEIMEEGLPPQLKGMV